jgi:hypothetical protein
MVTIAELKVLKYFPYETVRIVGKGMVTFPINPMRSFEETLVKLAGVKHADNKVCYYVDLGNQQVPKYFMFKDFWMFMGDEIEPYWGK